MHQSAPHLMMFVARGATATVKHALPTWRGLLQFNLGIRVFVVGTLCQRAPPRDHLVELLCEDHNGTYVLPYPCQWRGGAWHNSVSHNAIGAKVVDWRWSIFARPFLRCWPTHPF